MDPAVEPDIPAGGVHADIGRVLPGPELAQSALFDLVGLVFTVGGMDGSQSSLSRSYVAVGVNA